MSMRLTVASRTAQRLGWLAVAGAGLGAVMALQPMRVETAVETELRRRSARTTAAHDVRLVAAVRAFYASRRHAPAWTDADGWTPRAGHLRAALRDAPAEGLDATSYTVPPLEDRTPGALARAEVDLSLVALRFAEDLGWGSALPGEVDRANSYTRQRFPAESLLTAWSGADDVQRAVLRLIPSGPGYRRLRSALAVLRAQRTPWDTVPHGAPLRIGAVGPRVRALAHSLGQRGDLAADPGASDTFDVHLAAAVARFQARHGLMGDSVFGPVTRAAMNVPITTRIRQVELGMERVRWLPPIDTGWWITVNLADQRAFVLNAGRMIFSTRVVIGTVTHKTPMFTGTLTHIVLNPAWNVPPSIAAKEIWPAVQRDSSYLERNHMVRVADGIQQLPGPWNALGQIAFMFPNRFNVYMHDTPAKALFDRPDRAHSHGCIRVQRPHEMAELLLARQRWSRAQLDSAIATGERSVVMLRDPIPVRITYATAFMDDDGTLQFRPDIYNRDATLDAHLQRRRAPLAP